jgi:hypothetical protein
MFVQTPSGTHMLKAIAAVLFAISFMNQVDQFLSQGRYTQGLLAMAHDMVRSFVG